jgi:hypothetical protein
MFSDLECDYINPIDLCNKLNTVRPLCYLSARLFMPNMPDVLNSPILLDTVCSPGNARTRLLDPLLLADGSMDLFPRQRSSGRLQR